MARPGMKSKHGPVEPDEDHESEEYTTYFVLEENTKVQLTSAQCP
jgi:hypothetical protein